MLPAASRSVSTARANLRATGILLVALIGCALGQRGSAAQTDSAALLIYLPPGAMPRAVGGNGAIVVGGLRAGGGFYWMPTTGVIYIGGKEAIAVSRDGQTIVGTGINAPDARFEAGKWLRAAEWQLLGSFPPSPTPCDSTLSTGYGSNGDGSIIVGLGHNGCSMSHAFRWDATTGVVDLGSSVAGRPSRANRISADGKVIVGWQGLPNGFWQGARWIDGRQELLVGPLGPVSEAQAINHDGSIIAGTRCSGITQNGWILTPRDGIECLPAPAALQPGGPVIEALSLSDDGRVIGGAQTFGLDSAAVLWIDREPFYLRDYLRQHGVPQAFEGWINTGFVTGVSPDGHVVVGFGAGPTDFQGYVVILPKER